MTDSNPQDNARGKAILDAAREALETLYESDAELMPDEMITAACFMVGSLISGALKLYGADPLLLLAVSNNAIREAAGIRVNA